MAFFASVQLNGITLVITIAFMTDKILAIIRCRFLMRDYLKNVILVSFFFFLKVNRRVGQEMNINSGIKP